MAFVPAFLKIHERGENLHLRKVSSRKTRYAGLCESPAGATPIAGPEL